MVDTYLELGVCSFKIEGRTVNGANQLGLLGADCLTGYLDANNQSVFNFEY